MHTFRELSNQVLAIENCKRSRTLNRSPESHLKWKERENANAMNSVVGSEDRMSVMTSTCRFLS
jgi:hypothetical protein